VFAKFEDEQVCREFPEVADELNRHSDSDFRSCMLARLVTDADFGQPKTSNA